MIYVISLIIAIVIIGLSIGASYIYKDIKFREHKLINGFNLKASIDLVGLPMIVLYQNNTKFHFVLDTGSDACVVHKGLLDKLEHTKYEEIVDNMGINGDSTQAGWANSTFYNGNFKYNFDYQVLDISQVRDAVKEDKGVIIDGLIGTDFLTKYKYLIDFEKMICYPGFKK